MKVDFKKISEAVANLFTLQPEIKAQEAEIRDAMAADAAELTTQLEALQGEKNTLQEEKAALEASLVAEQQKVTDLTAQLGGLTALQQERDELKAKLDAQHQAIGGAVGDDAGQITEAAATSGDAEMERLRREHPMLMQGL